MRVTRLSSYTESNGHAEQHSRTSKSTSHLPVVSQLCQPVEIIFFRNFRIDQGGKHVSCMNVEHDQRFQCSTVLFRQFTPDQLDDLVDLIVVQLQVSFQCLGERSILYSKGTHPLTARSHLLSFNDGSVNVMCPVVHRDGQNGLSHPRANPNDTTLLLIVGHRLGNDLVHGGNHHALQFQEPLLHLTTRFRRGNRVFQFDDFTFARFHVRYIETVRELHSIDALEALA